MVVSKGGLLDGGGGCLRWGPLVRRRVMEDAMAVWSEVESSIAAGGVGEGVFPKYRKNIYAVAFEPLPSLCPRVQKLQVSLALKE